MQKWEYLRINYPDDATLKQLGEQGWELVAIDFSLLNGYTSRSGNVYVFKRPK